MRRSRAFSLLEIMLTFALALLLLGLSSIGRGGKGATSHGLAQILAEELRAARMRAMTSGMPVALVFPSESGGRSHSQSFYLLEGYSRPTVKRVLNFAGEFPRSVFFVGLWNLDPASLRNSALGNSATPPADGLLAEGFSASSWLPADLHDYALIFTPSGGVVSNALTSFDGDFHVIVSQGVQYADAAPPSGAPVAGFPVAYRSPTMVFKPYTVNLSRAGSVTISQGVTGAAAMTEAAGPVPCPAAARPPSLAAAPNHSPVLQAGTPETAPAAQPATLPGTLSATLGEGEHLTLKVRALDADGDPLWLRWTASSGTLSSTSEVRMEPVDWQASDRVWEGVWEWRPSVPWSDAQLSFEVSDRRGGKVSGQLGATGKVGLASPGRLAFVRDVNEVCVMKPDGTSLLSHRGEQWDEYYFSVFSPDGERLALVAQKIDAADNTDTRINLLTRDLRRDNSTPFVGEGWDSADAPSWHPNSSRVAATRCLYDANYDIQAANITNVLADGTMGAAVVQGAAPVASFQWSLDASKYCYLCYSATTYKNCLMVGGGIPTRNLTQAGSTPTFVDWISSPCWSPSGNQLAYSDDGIIKVAPSGGGPATVIGAGYTPSWSPSGNHIAFFDEDGRLFVNTFPPTAVRALVPDNPLYINWFGSLPPAWSPDGLQLAFCAGDETSDIYRVNLDGTQLVNLTNTPNNDEYDPSWSRR